MRSYTSPGNVSHADLFELLETRQLLSAWFVDPAGSDAAAGSLQTPLASVSAAIAKAQPGDTISLKGNAAHKRFNITKSGLTFNSYGNGFAMVKESPNADKAAVYIDAGVNNTVLNGLDVSGGFYALMIEGDGPDSIASRNILVNYCNLHSSGRDVVKITPGANDVTIQYSLIHDSDKRGSGNAEGIDAVNADNLTVRGNRIYNVTTNGVYAKGGSRNSVIEYNIVHDTGHGGILLGQDTDVDWFGKDNPEHYESITGVVRGNIIENTGAAGVGLWGAFRPRVYGNVLKNVASKYQGAIYMTSVEYNGGAKNVSPRIYDNAITLANPKRFAVQIQPGSLSGQLEADRNQYFADGAKVRFIQDDVNSMNFTQWQAATQADANSVADVNPFAK